MINVLVLCEKEACALLMAKQPTRTPSIETVLHEQEFRPPAVDRTLSLLELLARSENGLTLSELCRKLSIPKSTAHYLIYTLVARGYLQRRSDGRHYSLGLRLADLANATLAEADLRTLAAPTLLQIAARTKLTATISVLRGAEAIIIGKAESFQDMGGGPGSVDISTCTAPPKGRLSSLFFRMESWMRCSEDASWPISPQGRLDHSLR